MNNFYTESSSKRSVITVVCTSAVMFALAFLGLAVTLAAWIFFEAIVLVVFVICLMLTKKTYWKIEFTGNTLTIFNNGNGQSYVFTDLNTEDFKITQSEAQKAKNTCDMRISDAPFAFYDVADCKELKEYIEKHFN